jgi:hypothetical protein
MLGKMGGAKAGGGDRVGRGLGGTAICKSRPSEKGQVIGRREYARRGN